jgi:hypothetical protein
MRLPVLAAALCLAWPAAAHAETCAEEHETCLEDCHIDHGLAKEREKLAKCVKRCQDRLDDCHDLRQEERRSHVDLEKAPEERKHGSDPADLPKAGEDKPTDVSPAPVEEFDEDSKKGRGGKPRASPPPDEAPPKKVKGVEDEAPPPPKKKEEPPKKKQQEFPDSRKSDDDWSKER